MTRRFLCGVLVALGGCAAAPQAAPPLHETRVLQDADRHRAVPIQIDRPAAPRLCTPSHRCPVAFVSHGYGLPNTAYAFVARALNQLGYVVVSIQHDLPTDPPLASTGTLIEIRTPLWQRGMLNLQFVRSALARQERGVDWSRLILVGHSNGGDLSAYTLTQHPDFASALITLDNRRYPLPRAARLRVLSVRGSDFAADPGVLPSAGETPLPKLCLHRIAGARHDDMNDEGPEPLQQEIASVLSDFLSRGRCD